MIHNEMRYRRFGRSICLLTAFFFCVSVTIPAYAQKSIFPTVDKKKQAESKTPRDQGASSTKRTPLDPLKLLGVPEQTLVESIQIPPEYGRVTETYQGDAKAPVIVHIQDVHVHYEAQKNLAHILEKLVQDRGLKLVLVEGGSGDASLSFLRPQASKEKRLEVAEKYLKMGKISGEEYLDLTSDYPLVLWGVENEGLYDKNLAVFLEVDKFKEKVLKNLHGLQEVLWVLQHEMFSSELKAVAKKKSAYEKGEIDAVAYYQFLGELAGAKGVDLSRYPNFDNFLKAAGLEHLINFDEVDKEHQTVIGKLANLLDKGELSQLAEKGLKYKLNEASPKDYYGFLKEILAKKDPSPGAHRNLDLYIDYVVLYATRDHFALLKEGKVLEAELKGRMFRSDDERQLSEISDRVELFLNFFEFNLAPEDLAYYRTNRDSFLISRWLPFLKKKMQAYRVSQPLPEDLAALETYLPTLESFYEIGSKRDYAFVENALKKLDETDEKLAVLISGGFHTGQLTQLLRERGLSYVVIAPKVTQPSNLELYHSILKEKTTPTDKVEEE